MCVCVYCFLFLWDFTDYISRRKKKKNVKAIAND